ncbi:hypothetical protein DPMN_147284 [Dreissena polymorpha]|uniref:Kazal-like domain-containing protein n=1 Tax=Dreissena polymorpha TaxID=45954 RepID=A0A9D4F7L1_DREPO|nr:hypothetical protein DPMN_147284 [Dreissena polymorpha]
MRYTIVVAMFLLLAISGSDAGPGCACLAVWDPVCGVDGKTYSNEGCLRCAGVALKHTGECSRYG